MKLDEKGIEAAIASMKYDHLAFRASDIERAIQAYLKATDTVLVPSKTAFSANALLIGLSRYWSEDGDEEQSEYVASVAQAIKAAEGK